MCLSPHQQRKCPTQLPGNRWQVLGKTNRSSTPTSLLRSSALEECIGGHPQITPKSPVATKFTSSDDFSYSIFVLHSSVEAFLKELENPASMPSSANISPGQREYPSQKITWVLGRTLPISDWVPTQVRGNTHGFKSVLSPCAGENRASDLTPGALQLPTSSLPPVRYRNNPRKKKKKGYLSARSSFMLWIHKILQGT